MFEHSIIAPTVVMKNLIRAAKAPLNTYRGERNTCAPTAFSTRVQCARFATIIDMGKIVIEDGAAGFILPYSDIVAWGFKDGEGPNPRLADARNTRAIFSMDDKLKTLNRHLSLSPSRYRWSMDSERFEPSQLIILQWRREVGQVLEPGNVEKAVSKFLESIGYKGRKEWIVTGECDRFRSDRLRRARLIPPIGKKAHRTGIRAAPRRSQSFPRRTKVAFNSHVGFIPHSVPRRLFTKCHATRVSICPRHALARPLQLSIYEPDCPAKHLADILAYDIIEVGGITSSQHYFNAITQVTLSRMEISVPVASPYPRSNFYLCSASTMSPALFLANGSLRAMDLHSLNAGHQADIAYEDLIKIANQLLH
ncbi:hypothetical protein NM688_g8665 [Phlebia brevispora]|uniref:Uncharacterized protein n=1 Tax=Phlebia brevispora TaxID=194682 RepID=A0ACC1RPS4_9APHY|nr:hypothetical protein NM688_g8665 [Phlebia brevispora]